MSAVISPTVRKITAVEFHRMGEAGILRPDERVELLDGKIFAMAPIGSRHASTVNRLAHCFHGQLATEAANQAIVSTQNPVRLSDLSEPLPDLCLLRHRSDFYWSRCVEPADVLLLIEVADSSLNLDRKVKLPLYAASGIAELWIVDLNQQTIEVCDALVNDGDVRAYGRRRVHRGADRIAVGALPQVSLTVESLFAQVG